MGIDKIISGGQTGVDRAALDVAIAYNIPHGGWCPRGRMAEDGIIDGRYGLKETDSSSYACRTEWNVRDADGSLILNSGELDGGTAFTVRCIKNHRKPCLIIDLDKESDVQVIVDWIAENHIKRLNVAGPRASKRKGIYNAAYRLLEALIIKM